MYFLFTFTPLNCFIDCFTFNFIVVPPPPWQQPPAGPYNPPTGYGVPPPYPPMGQTPPIPPWVTFLFFFCHVHLMRLQTHQTKDYIFISLKVPSFFRLKTVTYQDSFASSFLFLWFVCACFKNHKRSVMWPFLFDFALNSLTICVEINSYVVNILFAFLKPFVCIMHPLTALLYVVCATLLVLSSY